MSSGKGSGSFPKCAAEVPCPNRHCGKDLSRSVQEHAVTWGPPRRLVHADSTVICTRSQKKGNLEKKRIIGKIKKVVSVKNTSKEQRNRPVQSSKTLPTHQDENSREVNFDRKGKVCVAPRCDQALRALSPHRRGALPRGLGVARAPRPRPP